MKNILYVTIYIFWDIQTYSKLNAFLNNLSAIAQLWELYTQYYYYYYYYYYYIPYCKLQLGEPDVKNLEAPAGKTAQ